MKSQMGAQLITERTTDPRVFRWMLLQSSEVWKDDLTAEQYVSRDDVLTPSKLYNFYDVKNPTGIYYYILRDLSIEKPETDDELALLTFNIVCSCELLVRKSWLILKGEQKEVLSGCVGSVYTISQHRSKGFAGLLMQNMDGICLELLGKDGFISLYSEIGNYYQKFGYHSYPVDVVEFPLITDSLQIEANELKFEEFKTLIDRYGENLSQFLIGDTIEQQVAIVPTSEMIDWHHLRSRYISKVLNKKYPENFGFQIEESFIVFSHDYSDKSLTVLMVYATDSKKLENLLQCVGVEAAKTGYKDVHMWGSQLYDYKLKKLDVDEKLKIDRFIVDGLKGEVGIENSSLSALKMLDGSYSKWGGNHKWPWF